MKGHLVVDFGLLAMVFGVVFVAELPDKTALASLVLGTRYRPSFVLVGMAAAFAVHVAIAVAAGSALSLAPERLVQTVVAVLFLTGGVLLLRRGSEPAESSASDPADLNAAASADAQAGPADHGNGAVAVTSRTRTVVRPAGFWRVAGTSFGVLFVAEFGDLTQIATANLAAQHHALLTVAIGAVLGLWAVGGLAILGGRTLLRWIPLAWITRVAALVMIVLGVVSAIHAALG